MTMTDTPVPAAARTDKLRLALIVLAALEIQLSIYPNVPMLFEDDFAGIIGGGLSGALVLLEFVGRPILAVAALIFALRRNPRVAIVAIAGITFLIALGLLPSAIRHGLYQGGNGIMSVHATTKVTLYPLLAFGATALALRNERLGLAALLVAIPLLASIVSFTLFSMSILAYGF
jgi:hypothetical protein